MLPAALLVAGEWTWFTPSMGLHDENEHQPVAPHPHSGQPVFDASY
jgi:hypothetical protein